MSTGGSDDDDAAPGPRANHHVWMDLAIILTIFGAVFALCVFLIPATTPLQTVVVVLGSSAATMLIWRTIAAILRHGPDWWLLGTGVATLVCTVWFSALLVQDRDGDNGSLQAQSDEVQSPSRTNPATEPPVSEPLAATPLASTAGTLSIAPKTTETSAPLSSTESILSGEREPDPAAWSSGRVRLFANGAGVDFESWQMSLDVNYISLSMSTSTLSGAGGVELGSVIGTTAPNFATCRDATIWRTVVLWSDLPAGSWMCVRGVSGRRGAILLETVPTEEDKQAEISGVIWEPVVDE